jgi:hypothetical protein
MGKGNRSGGPKTPAGKAASSKNALKLGVYSKQQFLPGEKPEDFENLKLRFSECLKPIDIVEFTLVHEITLLAWKKLRLERVENQYLLGILNSKPSVEEFFQAGLERNKHIADILSNPFFTTLECIESHRRYLKALRQWQVVEVTQEVLAEIRAKDPDFYAYLVKGTMGEPQRHDLIIIQDEKLREVRIHIENSLPDINPDELVSPLNVRKAFGYLTEFSEAVIYVNENKERLESYENLIRDRRLKVFMESSGSIRAYQELSRSFSKLLTELRKQQEYRQSNLTVELEAA